MFTDIRFWTRVKCFGTVCVHGLLCIKNADNVQIPTPHSLTNIPQKMQTVILLRGITNTYTELECVAFFSIEMIEPRFIAHSPQKKQSNEQYKCKVLCWILTFSYWDEHWYPHSCQIFRCEINVIWIRDLSNEASSVLCTHNSHVAWIRFDCHIVSVQLILILFRWFSRMMKFFISWKWIPQKMSAIFPSNI